jgi:hypothetical protein
MPCAFRGDKLAKLRRKPPGDTFSDDCWPSLKRSFARVKREEKSEIFFSRYVFRSFGEAPEKIQYVDGDGGSEACARLFQALLLLQVGVIGYDRMSSAGGPPMRGTSIGKVFEIYSHRHRCADPGSIPAKL